MKTLIFNKKFLAYLAFIFLITACASHYQDATRADPYGFFSGIWHGFILPFSFLGYLFVDGVYVIGEPNTGGTYIFGFIIGLTGLLGTNSR